LTDFSSQIKIITYSIKKTTTRTILLLYWAYYFFILYNVIIGVIIESAIMGVLFLCYWRKLDTAICFFVISCSQLEV